MNNYLVMFAIYQLLEDWGKDYIFYQNGSAELVGS